MARRIQKKGASTSSGENGLPLPKRKVRPKAEHAK